MKECKSIEVMNTDKMQIRRDSKPGNRIQISQARDGRMIENNGSKPIQLMQEAKSTEAMNIAQKPSRRDAKSWNRPQMYTSRVRCTA
jgi:hypothetical protein